MSVLAGNTWYVDATGTLSRASECKVAAIILSPASHGSGSPSITLQDNSPSNANKLTLMAPNTTSLVFNFEDTPLQFFNGIKVSALSGAVATIVFKG